MEPEQELVYGWLGLNPALLLDAPPPAENLVVRVVRPGEDAEAVLEEARQQLAAAGPRRRRRGRGGSGAGGDGAAGSSASPAPAPADHVGLHPAVAVPEGLPRTVEITPLPEDAFHPVAVLPDATIEVPASPRTGRGRSRTGAAVSVSVQEPALGSAPMPVVVAESAVVAVAPEPELEPASAEDDNGEPRRRRRRSSASGD